MVIHGASFDSATIQTDWFGKCTGLITAKNFSTSRRKISADEFSSVDVITSENASSIGFSSGGAIIGTLLAGPVGLLIGGLKSGKQASHLVGITLAGGEGFVAEVSKQELTLLLGAVSRAANAQREIESCRDADTEVKRYVGQIEDRSEPAIVLKRISYADRLAQEQQTACNSAVIPETLDTLKQYASRLRELCEQDVLNDSDVAEAKRLRKGLGLKGNQVAFVHASVFRDLLAHAIETGELAAESALSLRETHSRLIRLGWAPGA